MVNWPDDAAKLRGYDRLAAENEQLRREGVPGVMHEVDKSFHKLAIQERDYARLQVEHRERELAELRSGNIPDLRKAREAWMHEIRRLLPVIMRNALASAIVAMADQVFNAYDAHLMRLVKQLGESGLTRENAELKTRVQQLHAELDDQRQVRVLLCPSPHIPAAMATSMGEEDGTLIRASDDPTLEWVLKEGAWVPTA